MSRNIWIGIVVVVVLAVGAWWYLNQSNMPTAPVIQTPIGQTTQTQQQNTTNSQPSTQTDQSAPSEAPTTNQPSPSNGLSATPTSGAAPLTVMFNYVGDTYVLDSPPSGYPTALIDFGDGSSGSMTAPFGEPTCGATCAVTASHTYTSPGTYTVQVSTIDGNVTMSEKVLAIQTVAITGNYTADESYNNSQYGFSIQYPNSLTVNPPCAENNSPESCSSQNLISFYATAAQPANGFAYGYVILPEPSVVGRCASDPGNGVGTYSTTTINGIAFGVYGIGSAGAGTQEAITTYSTERNGLCYSIVEDEYDHYSGGTYVSSQAKTDLESIVQTFHFTN